MARWLRRRPRSALDQARELVLMVKTAHDAVSRSALTTNVRKLLGWEGQIGRR